jgi:short-subunit dehydrogenase
MAQCIEGYQKEIEELEAINTDMIEVELKEKQKVIDAYFSEIQRQKDQITRLLIKNSGFDKDESSSGIMMTESDYTGEDVHTQCKHDKRLAELQNNRLQVEV